MRMRKTETPTRGITVLGAPTVLGTVVSQVFGDPLSARGPEGNC